MEILEIVLTGYVVNLFSIFITISYVMIYSITSIILNGPIEAEKHSTIIQHLDYESKELRKGVPWQLRYHKDNYAILFPFMYIIPASKILLGSLRFGIQEYLIYKMTDERARLERYWQNKEDRK